MIARARLISGMLSTLVIVACGGSPTTDPVAVCSQLCQRYASLCNSEAGPAGATSCQSMQCSAIAGTTCKYSNMGAITAAVEACSVKSTCEELQSCLSTTVPAGVGCNDAGGE
jgi:hypothetical protein